MLPDPAIRLGAHADAKGVDFAVWAPDVEHLELILGTGARARVRSFQRSADAVHRLRVPRLRPGAVYALRAGERLLVDPYAVAIDQPYGAVLPRAIVPEPLTPVRRRKPAFRPGGLIYEMQLRAFTMQHPDVPPADRGRLAALTHKSVIDHLRKLGVSAVQLMPVIAWANEPHLAPLGLVNSWGYNSVTFMALDPRFGTLQDLRAVAEALHRAGIDLFLDLVFNHTAEGDARGPTLSFRALANEAYYRHDADGNNINDTGCGNTVACDHPMMRRMILDTLRHFTLYAGVDGFRFDLAPILGRTAEGFDAEGAMLSEMIADPILSDRIFIAEPWDIGPGGYQLGKFPDRFLEWNDRYRDDMRRFWRGDPQMVGALATRLSGSSDIFAGQASRSVNFIAAHDGFTLADMTAYVHRHNQANGENNRDGHGENHSWNSGVEGATDDPAIIAARRRDVKALLATLFASRGTIMLTAGDEFGRTQRGNNNAYCQDNDLTWLNWAGRDLELEAYAFALAQMRRNLPELSDPAFLSDEAVAWLTADAERMTLSDWHDAGRDTLMMRVGRVLILFNRSDQGVRFTLPDGTWDGDGNVAARSVQILIAQI